MKRTCNGCRALAISVRIGFECELGFPINDTWNGYRHIIAPLQQCPKPKTYEEYFQCREKREKEGTR